MQNCPITTSPYRRCVFLRYETLHRECILLQDFTRALYQTTRRRPWRGFRINFVWEWVPNSTAGGFYYKTVRGQFTRLPGGGAGGEASNLVGKKMWGFCPHSLTSRLHGRKRQNNSSDAGCRFLLHILQVTRSSYSVETAMEVLLQEYTGPRTSYQIVRRLFFSLFDYQTARGSNETTNPLMTASVAFFKPKTDLLKY